MINIKCCRNAIASSLIWLMAFMSSGCSDSSGVSEQVNPGPVKQVVAIQVAPQSTLSQGVTQTQLPVGVRAQYEATITYSDGTFMVATGGVAWSTSNTNAAVSSSGVVTANHAGNLVIEASLDGIKGRSELRVTDAALTALQLTPAAGFITKGVSRQWGAQGVYSDDTTTNLTTNVKWSSSDTSIVSVAEGGMATAHNVGTAVITATFNDVTASSEVAVTGDSAAIIDDALSSLEVMPDTTSIAKGVTQQFTAQGTLKEGAVTDLTNRVYWSSSNNNVAAINASGLATGKAVGTTTITATLNGMAQMVVLTVTDAMLTTIQLAPTSASMAKGLSRQFVAKGVYSDNTQADLGNKVIWLSSDSDVATINTTGLATAKGVGVTSISAALGNIKATAELSVTDATLSSIQLTPNTIKIANGATQQIAAQGTYSDNTIVNLNSSVAWRSSNTKVASVSPSGEVNALGAGTATITVSLDGLKAIATTEVTKGSYAVTWQLYPQPYFIAPDAAMLSNISSISITNGAMAGLKTDGSVVIWGDPMYGADSTAVWPQLTNVRAISGNYYGFAALKLDGSVVTWAGYNSWGSGRDYISLPVSTNVQSLIANHNSFAALTQDGRVVSWGGRQEADSSVVQDKLTNIKTIFANGYLWSEGAFAALKQDGSVVTWGTDYAGGDSTSVEGDLVDVEAIYSAPQSFAALKRDGSVVTWGNGSAGDSLSVKDQLVDVQTIVSSCSIRSRACNGSAFAALKQDGTVVTWGDSGSGGDSSNVKVDLVNVKAIYSNGYAFAALKQDGLAVTWGDANGGGDSSNVEGLSDIKEIYTTEMAFAALKHDGTVVTWGDSRYGGDSSAVKTQLIDVQTILSSASVNSGYSYFVAIKSDGSNVVWGSPDYQQTANVLTPLKNIKAIFSTPSGLSAAIAD